LQDLGDPKPRLCSAEMLVVMANHAGKSWLGVLDRGACPLPRAMLRHHL
jgi:hypothetical protein